MDAPIFILGIGHRSGTNYLAHLLQLHPATTSLETIGEDYLFAQLDLLDDYVSSTARHWNPEWREGGTECLLKRSLGSGLVKFLRKHSDDPDKAIVTKTPSTRNLDQVFDFMPNARLVIIVRDGQSLAASSLKSFGGSFDEIAYRWKASADRIHEFCATHGSHGERHYVVRYEDLFSRTDSVLKRLLRWLELPEHEYDLSAARQAPVIGSSEVVDDNQGEIHWRPVERDSNFDPLRRASALSAYQRSRFAWLAGSAAAALGYEVDPVYRRNPLFGILHALQDVPLLLRKTIAANAMRIRKLTNMI